MVSPLLLKRLSSPKTLLNWQLVRMRRNSFWDNLKFKSGQIPDFNLCCLWKLLLQLILIWYHPSIENLAELATGKDATRQFLGQKRLGLGTFLVTLPTQPNILDQQTWIGVDLIFDNYFIYIYLLISIFGGTSPVTLPTQPNLIDHQTWIAESYGVDLIFDKYSFGICLMILIESR